VDAGAAEFARTLAFGRVVGVALPAEDDVAGLAALAARLLPDEQAHARGLRPARRPTWMGGRAALRAALGDLGLAAGPILSTPRGAPLLPPGVLGSIAHKRTLAIAIAARASPDVTLGIDVELARAPRVDIAARVLTPAERRRVDALAPEPRARAVLTAFAAKEAVYKALDPWLGRAVSFQEVELATPLVGATFTPRAGEPSFDVEVHEEPLAGHVLVLARAQRRGSMFTRR